jgi:glycosyltransferase involved in cell wall biosynthesis
MMNFLYDLTAAQPTPDSKFHGAGAYSEIIFLKLLEVYNPATVSICAAWDSSRYINPELIDAAKEHTVGLYDIQKCDPADIFRQHHIDRFYSALLDESIPWPLEAAEVITTVHGLRSLEMPLDKIALDYELSLKGQLKTFIKLYLAPGYYVRKVYAGYRRFFTGHMKIITVSRHSKASILSFFPSMKPEDIRVYSSPTFDQLETPRAVIGDIQTFGLIPQKYFLLTSSARWIKNNMRAVLAFDSLASDNSLLPKNFKIVLTGVADKSVFLKQIRHKDRFVLLDYIERNGLAVLEQNAYAFIYPSLNEGFGYPPVEAMKYGVPVAASGISSIPEVCGDAALYFDPYSISEIKNRMIQLLDPEIRNLYADLAVKQYTYVSVMQKRDLEKMSEYLLKEQEC